MLNIKALLHILRASRAARHTVRPAVLRSEKLPLRAAERAIETRAARVIFVDCLPFNGERHTWGRAVYPLIYRQN